MYADILLTVILYSLRKGRVGTSDSFLRIGLNVLFKEDVIFADFKNISHYSSQNSGDRIPESR